MTSLTDTQSILLAAAAQREDRSLLPIPTCITAPAGGVAKSLSSLVAKGFAEERELTGVGPVHRADGDLRFGLFATTAGMAAIGVEGEGAGATVPPVAQPALPARRGKTAAVLALLEQSTGATMADLITATGWLPHTTRAALTGLRKKGHTIERSKRDAATCYRIVTPA